MWVVEQVQRSTGIGTNPLRTYDVSYAGAKVNLSGRGFLGFASMAIADSEVNTTTQTTYRQDFPYIGQKSSTLVTRTSDSHNLSSTAAYYKSLYPYAAAPNVHIIYPWQTVRTEYELDGIAIKTEIQTDTYDNYGSVTKSILKNGQYTTTTDTVYLNDTAKWALGLPKQVTVTQTDASPPTAAEARLNRVTTYDYHPTTRLLTQEVVEPNDALLHLQTSYGHDAFGNRTAVIMSTNGFDAPRTYIQYDTKGQFPLNKSRMPRLTGPFQTEIYSYDARFGSLKSLTDVNKVVTRWEYDPLGFMTYERRPDGTKTQILQPTSCSAGSCATDAAYSITTQTDGKPTQATEYDILQRPVRSKVAGFSSGWSMTDTTYDTTGRVARKSRPYTGGTPSYFTYTYDEKDRPLTETTPDSAPKAAVTYAYSGLTVSTTNAKSQKTTKTVNVRGQLVQVTDTALNSTTYQYDGFGNLRFVQDPADNLTESQFDRRGNKIFMHDPDMGTWTYDYTPLGQLWHEINPDLQLKTYEYDLFGRLTKRTEPEGTSTWEYDGAAKGIGKPWKVTGDNRDVRTFAYDTLGRLSGISVSYGGKTLGLSYGYDTLGRPKTITYPTGFVAEQRYNSAGYFSALWGSDSHGSTRYWLANSLMADGQVYEATLGNGLSSRTTYDPMGRPKGILTGTYQGTTLGGTVQNTAFRYDVLGNLDRRSDIRAGISESFTYDNLNRLDTSQVSGQPPKNYDYDALGNLTFKTGVGTYTYNRSDAGPHAVTGTTVGDKKYSYDAKGNMTSGDGRTIAYTSYNKPRQISVGGSVVPTKFVYGADRQRIHEDSPDGAKAYLDDGQLRYEKLDIGGQTTHTHYLYAGGKMVAQYVTTNLGAWGADYFHHDHLGSIDTVTDGAGNVVERLSYDAHGRRRNSSTWADAVTPVEPVTTRRGFTEHEHLDSVGLIHMNGRVFDPVLGRFLSADPTVQFADNLQSFNRYSYVLNNPLSLTDPTGFGIADIIYSIGNLFGSLYDAVSSALKNVGDFVGSLSNSFISMFSSTEQAIRTIEGAVLASKSNAQSQAVRTARQGQNGVGQPVSTDDTMAGKKAALTSQQQGNPFVQPDVKGVKVAMGPVALGIWAADFILGIQAAADGVPPPARFGGLANATKNAVVDTLEAEAGNVARGVRFPNLAPAEAIGDALTFPANQIVKTSYSGTLNYVVTETGQLVIGRSGHTSLSMGADVLAAGEAKFVNGGLKWLDNASGHYKPSGAAALEAAESAFQRSGFDAAGKYVERKY